MNTHDMVDCRGLKCPLPVLRLQRALSRLPAGARLTLTCTDPMAAIDIPNFLRESGDHLLSSHSHGTVLSFMVEKS